VILRGSLIWVATISLTLVAGCGGNYTGGYAPAGFLLNTWTGTITGSDGSQSTLNVTVSVSGDVSGTVQMPSTTGVVYNVTGTGLALNPSSGTGPCMFNLTCPSKGFPNLLISATMYSEGGGLGSVKTYGSGTMTNGGPQVRVTLNLNGYGIA